MKLFSKIVVLLVFVVAFSSCEKQEFLPSNGSGSGINEGASFRENHNSDATNTGNKSTKGTTNTIQGGGDGSSNEDGVIGGGDDDRDGGDIGNTGGKGGVIGGGDDDKDGGDRKGSGTAG